MESILTNNEIIKALECCTNYICSDQCPLYDNCDGAEDVIRLALSFINRQNTKIERLQKYDEERDIRLHARLIETSRADAVKEYELRLKEKVWDIPYETEDAHYVQVVDVEDIENVAKEMVGDTNG